MAVQKLLVIVFILGMLTACNQEQVDDSIKEIDDQTTSADIVQDSVESHIEEPQEVVVVDIVEDIDDKQDIDKEAVEDSNEEDTEDPIMFEIRMIDTIMAEGMMGKSFHENDHVQLEDLRYIDVGYYGFDGENHQGAIVVHQVIAEDILAIFKELYDLQYPIERMDPIDVFDGDDDASMVANNTSAFNYRVVAGTNRLSRHAYGLAVDVNPFINPWVTSSGIYPPEGSQYADRTLASKGMILKDDPCYIAFTSRGFEWGGDWVNSKDYQHFDIKIEGINQ